MQNLKKRLDTLLVEKGLAPSREKAKALVMAGEVLVDGKPSQKAGMSIPLDSEVKIKNNPFPYVSRGGNKLQKALEEFSIDVTDLTALDVGASTGGFSECLLTRGAKKVYCVDVGYGQLDFKLRNDDRVVNLEKVNFRYLERERIPEKIDIAVVDVSFISLKLIVPKLKDFLGDGSRAICLVKPQFELDKQDIGKGGIVTDKSKQELALRLAKDAATKEGFIVTDYIDSPILGAKGNREFLIALEHGGSEV